MEGKITILGCGSALPTYQNTPSSQILELSDKSFMIDCGEGTQIAMRQMGIRTARLYCIFISHLHGDHCFGLLGLLTTFDMMGRTQPLHIYAHADLEKLLRPMMNYHLKDMKYEVVFHAINPRKKEVIFEDRTVTVETIPLKHTVPCCGFLFTERHRRKDAASGDFYVESRKRYAYCADTIYQEKMVEQISGVDMLFHESTFPDAMEHRCRPTMHSTARQAGRIARLAGVGNLLIGHYSARVDDHTVFLEEARQEFDSAILGEERKTYLF